MKRHLFIVLVIIGSVLIACETKYYSVTITNNSSKDVTYTYDDLTDTLFPGASKGYQVKAYAQPPKDISVEGVMSVEMENMGEEYIFMDVSPINLYVINTLPTAITIMANNYIDDNGSTKLTIDSMKEKKTARIYTKKPKFTTISGYSIIIDWKIESDVMYVTIR
jgi:hypothetical protein